MLLYEIGFVSIYKCDNRHDRSGRGRGIFNNSLPSLQSHDGLMPDPTIKAIASPYHVFKIFETGRKGEGVSRERGLKEII